MKFFWDGFPVDQFPSRIHRPGELFTRLVGVNVSKTEAVSSAGKVGADRLVVEPIYIPLLRWQRRAGQVWIEINDTKPLMYVTLQRRRPFIHVFRFPWELEPGET